MKQGLVGAETRFRSSLPPSTEFTEDDHDKQQVNPADVLLGGVEPMQKVQYHMKPAEGDKKIVLDYKSVNQKLGYIDDYWVVIGN